MSYIKKINFRKLELKTEISKNIFYIQNPQFFNQLLTLVQENPRSYSRKLCANGRKREQNPILQYKYLTDWIILNTPLLNDKIYSMPTKVYWILNGLTDFPICPSCQKNSGFKNKNVKLNGYCECCSVKCLNSYDKHKILVKNTIQKDPLFYSKMCQKIKQTRLTNNNGKWHTQKSLDHLHSTLKQRLEQNKNYYIEIHKKCQQTNILNGHPLNWNNNEKISYTKNINKYDYLKQKQARERKIIYSQQKYGVDDPSQSEIVKQHKKEAYLKKYGVDSYFKTQMFKKRMIEINEQRKFKEYQTKLRNKSFKTSKPEDEAFNILRFIFPKLKRQFKSKEYPFLADFYDPNQPNVRFEFQGSWTHGFHSFDMNNSDDIKKLSKWKSKNTKYYLNAINTWTLRDPYKRVIAKQNGIQLIEFWNIEDVRNFVINFSFSQSK